MLLSFGFDEHSQHFVIIWIKKRDRQSLFIKPSQPIDFATLAHHHHPSKRFINKCLFYSLSHTSNTGDLHSLINLALHFPIYSPSSRTPLIILLLSLDMPDTWYTSLLHIVRPNTCRLDSLEKLFFVTKKETGNNLILNLITYSMKRSPVISRNNSSSQFIKILMHVPLQDHH